MLCLAILRYIVHNTHMMNDLISKGVCYHLEFSSPANPSSNTYSYYVETSLLTIALFSIMNRVLMKLISGSSMIFGITKYEEKIPTIVADVQTPKKSG